MKEVCKYRWQEGKERCQQWKSKVSRAHPSDAVISVKVYRGKVDISAAKS